MGDLQDDANPEPDESEMWQERPQGGGLRAEVTPAPERACAVCRGWGHTKGVTVTGREWKTDCRVCNGTGIEAAVSPDPITPWSISHNDRRLLRGLRIKVDE